MYVGIYLNDCRLLLKMGHLKCITVGTCTTEQCDDTRGTNYTSGAECATESCSNALGANEEYVLGWSTSPTGCRVACIDGYARKDNLCTEKSDGDNSGAAADDTDGALIGGVAAGAVAFIAAVGIVVWCCCCKRNGSPEPDQDKTNDTLNTKDIELNAQVIDVHYNANEKNGEID